MVSTNVTGAGGNGSDRPSGSAGDGSFGGYGGGIFSFSSALTLTRSTVAGNTTGAGGWRRLGQRLARCSRSTLVPSRLSRALRSGLSRARSLKPASPTMCSTAKATGHLGPLLAAQLDEQLLQRLALGLRLRRVDQRSRRHGAGRGQRPAGEVRVHRVERSNPAALLRVLVELGEG
jgi:hypothetical protein